MSARVEVRHLRDGEAVPSLLAEFSSLDLQRAYVWVAESNGTIVGALLAGNLHGVLVLLRLITEKTAPTITSLALIKFALRQARVRHINLVATLITPEREEERKLGKLFERHAGQFMPIQGILAIGTVERKRCPL